MQLNQHTIGSSYTLDVAGHACRVFEPDGEAPHGYTVLYLHTAEVEDPAAVPDLAEQWVRHRWRVVAPQAGATWWSDRICPTFDATRSAERYLLDDVLPDIEARWRVRPPRIALLGIGMGGQGALRLAYKHPHIFPVVAAIAPEIDFQRLFGARGGQSELRSQLAQLYRDEEDARQDTATLHIHPLNWPRHQYFCADPHDPWYESADRLRMKLYSLGVPHTCDLETEAGGHGWNYFNAMAPRAMEFIMESLEKERMRVS